MLEEDDFKPTMECEGTSQKQPVAGELLPAILNSA